MTIHRAYDPRPLTTTQAWLARVFATAFGFGYSPIAPGTAGTLAPLIVLYLWRPARSWGFILAALALYLFGVVLASWGERLWRKSDPGHVCIDEVAGYLVSVAFVPARSELALLVAAFFVFRLFDIVKPPPGRRAERLPGGWGVMTDDVIAGVYGNVVLQIAAHVGWL
jgi:phosphatidylglycerophosphatase A